MQHEMQLDGVYFSRIEKGEKTVELRLFDTKRRQIAVGDLICFAKREDSAARLCCRVVALHRFSSFAALLDTPLREKCGFGEMSAAEAASLMRRYYSAESEAENGVLGIEIEVIGV